MGEWDHKHWMFLCVSLSCLGLLILGGLPLILGRPIVFSARWLLLLVLVSLMPRWYIPFNRPNFEQYNLPVESLPELPIAFVIAPPIMSLLVFVIVALSMRGYLAIAVTEVSLREGLRATLKQANLAYEERLGSIHLPSIGAVLQVSVQGWAGTGQIKAKDKAAKRFLPQLVRGMNEYFLTHRVETHMITSLLTTVLAIGMWVFLAALLF